MACCGQQRRTAATGTTAQPAPARRSGGLPWVVEYMDGGIERFSASWKANGAAASNAARGVRNVYFDSTH